MAFPSAAFIIFFPLLPNLEIEFAITFYCPHWRATSDIKFPKFSNEKVFCLAYSEVPPVNLFPQPAILFNNLLSLVFPNNDVEI